MDDTRSDRTPDDFASQSGAVNAESRAVVTPAETNLAGAPPLGSPADRRNVLRTLGAAGAVALGALGMSDPSDAAKKKADNKDNAGRDGAVNAENKKKKKKPRPPGPEGSQGPQGNIGPKGDPGPIDSAEMWVLLSASFTWDNLGPQGTPTDEVHTVNLEDFDEVRIMCRVSNPVPPRRKLCPS
jgi:hypothetical protein